MITSSINLGPITLDDYAPTGWSFSGLIDWWGQTDDKVPVEERPQQHGAFDESQSLRSSRAISFQAQYIGTSQADAENAMDVLAAIAAEGPVLMTVNTPAGSTWRLVTVSASKPEDHRARSWVSVAVDCIARDPRRYVSGSVVTTGPAVAAGGLVWPTVWPTVWPGGGVSGRVALPNVGRAPSSPVFTLVGGFDTALITCVETGARIGFDRPTPAGSTVLIDYAERRAWLGADADVSRWLRWREWEDVPGLSTRNYQFLVTNPVGSPTLSGRVDSAWW
jgi:hypothetical protein